MEYRRGITRGTAESLLDRLVLQRNELLAIGFSFLGSCIGPHLDAIKRVRVIRRRLDDKRFETFSLHIFGQSLRIGGFSQRGDLEMDARFSRIRSRNDR